jgi:demethylmenaquinone methyltransferase/2-methoxy-6-polyprenyl-1,4-benzoquinol methylase
MSSPPAGVRLADGSGRMFDGIAERYDLLNLLMSFGLDRRWRRRLVASLGVRGEAQALDVATGTADLAIAIARTYGQCRLVGLDPSEGMLEVGRRKVEAAGLRDRIELVTGDAQAMTFEDDRFDATCVSFGIRNFTDRSQGLREMARVTRPGGRVCVLELSEPDRGLLAPLTRFWVHAVVPALGSLISGRREYRYLQTSVAAFPPPDQFVAMMEEAGLRSVTRERMSFGAANLFVGTV